MIRMIIHSDQLLNCIFSLYLINNPKWIVLTIQTISISNNSKMLFFLLLMLFRSKMLPQWNIANGVGKCFGKQWFLAILAKFGTIWQIFEWAESHF